MTHTINAPVLNAPTGNRDRSLSAARRLLAIGASAGPLFLGLGVVQGLTREGFDFSRNAFSQLSLGELGWVQTASFVLTGLLIAAGALGVRQALDAGQAARWVPGLLGVFGASFMVNAVFRADAGAGFPVGTPQGPPAAISAQGAVHMVSGLVGFLSLCVAFFFLARWFAARQERGWALACRLLPMGVLAGFMGSGASVVAFTVGAGLGLMGLTAVTLRLALHPRPSNG
ncbi:DUF998 domain-containing protein [Streptomyces sp. NPDC056500]|uniref:DUF998 domain-containing protein n=1 Tax=Streptomyces sp. NPDC056500 TaxID=3345840 RepID=UPI0036C05C42